MAKKKSKHSQIQQQFSPEKYIRLKARRLAIDKCYTSTLWEETGIAEVLVARRHAGGNYTFGFFLLDTYCLGLKDSLYRFNITPYEFDDLVHELLANDHAEISYDEAHNLIYGAISYAEDLGIKPHKSFELTQYILEEDTEDIPLIEYVFGKDGSPHLVAENYLEASRYTPLLDKATGGDYSVEIVSDEEWNQENLFSSYPETPYTYQQPTYPEELNLTYPELNRLLTPFKDFLLSTEEIDQILSLPRETLIADLQQIVLYSIGQESNNAALTHALFFLGELKAEEALDTVLEVMRQSEDFMDISFDDSFADALGLTLYYVGRNKLSELSLFLKEPGLYSFFKSVVFIAVNYVASEPGRREEVLNWYRDLLNFYKESADDITVYSPSLGALMINELVDIVPKEILPEIKSFFDSCDVDEYMCDFYENIEEDVLADEFQPMLKTIDIYERYQTFWQIWGVRD